VKLYTEVENVILLLTKLFKYIGIKDSTRDLIFKKMFKKEVETRLLFSKIKNQYRDS